MSRVLVVGAQPGSLGEAIRQEADGCDYVVATAGVSGEPEWMDVVTSPMSALRASLAFLEPDHIIVTAGINEPEPPRGDDPALWYERAFSVNCTGPMRVLAAWRDLLRGKAPKRLGHFVVISSNSATVPRSGSAAYCASKAALSQAIRCAARELEGGDALGVIAYGYEPGLLSNTPMTDATAARWPGQPLTRMRGARLSVGVSRHKLAELVVGMLRSGPVMNGMMVPFDGGER